MMGEDEMTLFKEVYKPCLELMYQRTHETFDKKDIRTIEKYRKKKKNAEDEKAYINTMFTKLAGDDGFLDF